MDYAINYTFWSTSATTESSYFTSTLSSELAVSSRLTISIYLNTTWLPIYQRNEVIVSEYKSVKWIPLILKLIWIQEYNMDPTDLDPHISDFFYKCCFLIRIQEEKFPYLHIGSQYIDSNKHWLRNLYYHVELCISYVLPFGNFSRP